MSLPHHNRFRIWSHHFHQQIFDLNIYHNIRIKFILLVFFVKYIYIYTLVIAMQHVCTYVYVWNLK